MNKSANKMMVAGALIFGTAVSPAMADSFYGALDVGQTLGADACLGAPSACEDTATQFRAAGGYQFTPMWGAEVSYGASEKANLGYSNILGVIIKEEWEVDVFQISGVGTFYLGGGFALTAKAGIARTDLKLTASALGASASITSSTTNASFGVGARYDITERFAMRAQYENFGTVGDANTTGTSKITLLSAGVMFNF